MTCCPEQSLRGDDVKRGWWWATARGGERYAASEIKQAASNDKDKTSMSVRHSNTALQRSTASIPPYDTFLSSTPRSCDYTDTPSAMRQHRIRRWLWLCILGSACVHARVKKNAYSRPLPTSASTCIGGLVLGMQLTVSRDPRSDGLQPALCGAREMTCERASEGGGVCQCESMAHASTSVQILILNSRNGSRERGSCTQIPSRLWEGRVWWMVQRGGLADQGPIASSL
jgi:hypothetical protein